MRFTTALISIALFFVAGCGDDTETDAYGNPIITYDTVTYEMICDLCNLTMEGNSGTVQQSDIQDDGTGSWTVVHTRTNLKSDAFVYISAQNQNGSGTVSVRIVADGDVIGQSTSTGAYVIATASDSLP